MDVIYEPKGGAMTYKEVAEIAIAEAKELLNRGDSDSVHLANFVLRDLEATRLANLSDLAWAMHRDGSPSKNDVLGLIAHLELFLERGIH